MTKDFKEQMTKVQKARMLLLADNPFFGDLAFSVPVIIDDTLNPPTAAVSATTMYFHPTLVDKLTTSELMFVLAHEVLHLALMHLLRLEDRKPLRWNYACDIIVNQLLIDSKVGTAPTWIIVDPQKYKLGNGKVEEVYNLLKDEDCNEPQDILIPCTAEELENAKATIRSKLNQALQTAKLAGKVPGGIEAFVEQMTEPAVKWENVLREFVMVSKGRDRTYAKRNRRYAAVDTIMPGLDGEEMGEFAFAIDCSGSTSDAMVSQCGAEVNSIVEELRPTKSHILYFDTEVKKHEEYEQDEEFTVKVHGRGGTCFRTIFEYMAKNDIVPECLVVATDLGCDDFGPDPGFPVLWCVMEGGSYANTNVPFGRVLQIS